MARALVLLALLAACKSSAGVGGVHNHPPAVVVAPPSGPATLPPGGGLAFALDLDGVLVPEAWDVTGTVRALAQGRISFNSQGTQGNLLYRLPGQLVPRLAVGDEIRARRILRPGSTRSGWIVIVTAGRRLVVAGARLGGRTPREETFLGLRFTQGQADRILSRSRYGTTSRVPLTVRFGQNSIQLPLHRDFEFAVGNRQFRLHVLSSMLTRAGHQAAEGAGFYLQYAIVRR